MKQAASEIVPVTLMALMVLVALMGCAVPESTPPEEESTGAPPKAVAPNPEPVRVITDGRFDEWGTAQLVLDDPEDAPPGAALDLGQIRALDDPRWLHLSVDVRRLVNAQRMRGTLRILLDGDGNPGTGGEVLGMPGVDLIVELSRRDDGSEIGLGNGFRLVTAEGPGEIRSGYGIGLLSAPTTSAMRFEIRLERGHIFDGLPILMTSQTLGLKLVLEDSAGPRDETEIGIYHWTSPYTQGRRLSFEPSLTKAEGTFRVVNWNVAESAIRDHPEPFLRILNALDADVILLDEVYGGVTPEAVERFLSGSPLAATGSASWHFVLGRSGGRQKNVVATRLPLRPEEQLLEVAYPPGALESLADEVNVEEFRQLASEEQRRGVATAGAWVELAGREALLIPLDLQSAGYDGSPRDRLRELQASVLRQRIQSVVNAHQAGGGAAAVVVGGDFNLVGSSRPLEIIRGEGEGAAPVLTAAQAYRMIDRSQSTWRDVSGGEFTPGRLDYLLYSADLLTLDRAFVFDAAEFSGGHLQRLGVEREDSAVSGHLPVVGDFRWKEDSN